jgi:hypothetical protein
MTVVKISKSEMVDDEDALYGLEFEDFVLPIFIPKA